MSVTSIDLLQNVCQQQPWPACISSLRGVQHYYTCICKLIQLYFRPGEPSFSAVSVSDVQSIGSSGGKLIISISFLTCLGSVWCQPCCDCASPSLQLLRNYIWKLGGFLVIGSRHMLLFICRKWIFLKTRVHLGLTYIKVDRLESFVLSYSFLLSFKNVLFLKQWSPDLP